MGECHATYSACNSIHRLMLSTCFLLTRRKLKSASRRNLRANESRVKLAETMPSDRKIDNKVKCRSMVGKLRQRPHCLSFSDAARSVPTMLLHSTHLLPAHQLSTHQLSTHLFPAYLFPAHLFPAHQLLAYQFPAHQLSTHLFPAY